MAQQRIVKIENVARPLSSMVFDADTVEDILLHLKARVFGEKNYKIAVSPTQEGSKHRVFYTSGTVPKEHKDLFVRILNP